MVKQLYLLRHAQAENLRGGSDFDRSLTGLGVEQVRNLVKHLKSTAFEPGKIYCSPSIRTVQTTDLLLDGLGLDVPVFYEEAIYEASLRSLLNVLMKTEEGFSRCLLVGHNPAISHLCEYLTGTGFHNLAPGEMALIELADLEWSELSKGTGTAKTF